MTMDRTLRQHGGLTGTRSVLSRAERIKMLAEEGKFDPAAQSPFGLPKVKVKHSKVGGKTKKAAAEGEAAAEGAAPAEGAAAAPAAKGAAPAAKGAAPAAKGAAPAAKAPAAKGAKK